MMKIRKASARDWPGIKKLIGANPETLMQKHLPKAGDFFVAIEGGAVVGCCALAIYSKRMGEVRSLAVAKKFQGKGIATSLIKACLASAKKRRVYEIFTVTGAKRLFEKSGFGTFKEEKYALIKILGE